MKKWSKKSKERKCEHVCLFAFDNCKKCFLLLSRLHKGKLLNYKLICSSLGIDCDCVHIDTTKVSENAINKTFPSLFSFGIQPNCGNQEIQGMPWRKANSSKAGSTIEYHRFSWASKDMCHLLWASQWLKVLLWPKGHLHYYSSWCQL